MPLGNGAKVCLALLCMPYTPELITAAKGVLHYPHFAGKKKKSESQTY